MIAIASASPRAPPATSNAARATGVRGVGGATNADQTRRRRAPSLVRSTSSPSPSDPSSSDAGNQIPPANAGSSSGGAGGSAGGPNGRRRRKPGVFEVLVSTPPPRSLGYHSLPPDTHNGDRIEIDDKAFVVRRLVLRYRLERGRYVKSAQALEVASQGRYFVDQFLDQLVEK